MNSAMDTGVALQPEPYYHLRGCYAQSFKTQFETAIIEMYLAGVSVRRVEDITEALWGSKVSPATVSEMNKKAYVHIEDWRNRPLQGGRYPYVYVDGIYWFRSRDLDGVKLIVGDKCLGMLEAVGEVFSGEQDSRQRKSEIRVKWKTKLYLCVQGRYIRHLTLTIELTTF